MHRYQLVIFDWDGTIIDSTHCIVVSIQKACQEMGLPVPSTEKARWVIGLSLESALYHVVPSLSAEDMPAFVQSYKKHYLSQDNTLYLYKGITNLLDYLKENGILMAIATGKSRIGLDRALASQNLGHYFATTRTADETAGKPDPLMLHEILTELSINPDQAVMIGDTSHDVLMAQAAQMDSIAVTYGAHNATNLNQCKPSFMVNDVAELQRLLEMHLN